MTIPHFLDHVAVPFDNTYISQLVDVETGGVGIISTLRTLLLGLGWTEPSSNLFKTPVDAGGRFMDVLFTRISASTMEVRLRDQNIATICTRRFTIDTSPWCDVFIHASIYGLLVETQRIFPETFQAWILDFSPLGPTQNSQYVCGTGTFTTGGANDGSGDTVGDLFMVDNLTPTFKVRFRRDNVDVGILNIALMETQSREWLWKPIMVGVVVPGTTTRYAGVPFHLVQHRNGVPNGGVTRVSIDTHTKAPFRTFHLLTGDFGRTRLAVRIKEE